MIDQSSNECPLLTRQAELDFLVEQAERLLGAPARALLLCYAMQQYLLDEAVFEVRTGIGDRPPIEQFFSGSRGHYTVVGIERYRVMVDGQAMRVVRVVNGLCGQLPESLQDPWVVAASDYARLYRFLRRECRRRRDDQDLPPVMTSADQARLYDNTVGFLRRDVEELKRFGVPQKRGVLLLGEPGNGKTMACRWLSAQCQRAGLLWQMIDSDAYDVARAQNTTRELFLLDQPGIVLFDDFDLGMQKREVVGPSRDHSMLLAGLDGVEQRQGVVYLFTTNARLADLDPAFLRRGRIDLVIHFPRPDAALRRRLMLEFWHPDVAAGIDVERAVKLTEGLCFAAVEELKRLLVMRYLEAGDWNLDWAWENLNSDQTLKPRPSRIGFGAAPRRPPSEAESLGLPIGNRAGK